MIEKQDKPKGETAVLTAIEKDYGEEYINPAKSFIERIMATYEQFTPKNRTYRRTYRTVMEPTVAQDEAMEEDMNAIMAKAGEDKHGEEYMKKAREKWKRRHLKKKINYVIP